MNGTGTDRWGERQAGQGIGLRDLLPAGGLLAAGLAALAGGTLLGGADSGQYLVIAAPFTALDDTLGLIGRAGGGLVATGGLGNIVIAAADGPDFAARASAAGAWLVVPAPRVLGCFTPAEGVRQ